MFILHLCRTTWGTLVLTTGVLVTVTAITVAAWTVGTFIGDAGTGTSLAAQSEFLQVADAARTGDSGMLMDFGGSPLQLLLLLLGSMGASVLLAVALRSEPGQLIR